MRAPTPAHFRMFGKEYKQKDIRNLQLNSKRGKYR